MKKLLILLFVILLCSCSQKSEAINNEVEEVEEVVENISGSAEYLNKYNIPASFGRAKYSVEEIHAMKDFTAEELKEAISTISDLMQYYIETDFTNNYDYRFDYKVLCNDFILSVCRTPQATLETRSNCCQDVAALSRYILEDDYEEEGYIIEAQCSGNEVCGGHVYNYFKRGDDYFSIDFLGSTKFELARAIRAKSLEDYGKYIRHNDYYVYAMVATINYKDLSPATVMGRLTDYGMNPTFFFDDYYKDNIVKLHYDLDKMKEIEGFEIHELFEDVGFDKDSLPQDDIDANIGNLDNN